MADLLKKCTSPPDDSVILRSWNQASSLCGNSGSTSEVGLHGRIFYFFINIYFPKLRKIKTRAYVRNLKYGSLAMNVLNRYVISIVLK